MMKTLEVKPMPDDVTDNMDATQYPDGGCYIDGTSLYFVEGDGAPFGDVMVWGMPTNFKNYLTEAKQRDDNFILKVIAVTQDPDQIKDLIK